MINRNSHLIKLSMSTSSMILMVIFMGALFVWVAGSAPTTQTAAPLTQEEENQLDENCTVAILNRTARVQPDGNWRINNVPANFGQARARATCIKDGVTTSGQSDLFPLIANRTAGFGQINFADVVPVPASLTVTADTTTLTAEGATAQLMVTATYADDSTADVTASTAGATYSSSNRGVATVNEEGLVTALSSGSLFISVLNDGTLGMIRLQVTLSGDSDDDGIPNDQELANGLDPNNPVDALEDPDRDGLTNLEELIEHATDIRKADTDEDEIEDGEEVVAGEDGYITNPLLADTDNDGLPDGLETMLGTNPIDSNDPADLSQFLASIEVTPEAFVLTVNTFDPEASHQLEVTGHLINGMTIDLTSTTIGTNYSSNDLTICNFGVPDGRVFAGSNGTCTITVSNSGFTAEAAGQVETFDPIPLAFQDIPGYAYNVDVSGDLAYVAAGGAGLHVVNVSNRTAPTIIATLDTSDARDVKVVGNLAYVADGGTGLHLIDISTPTAPTLISTVDTTDARDVVIYGNRAYVADNAAGLRIIDVSNMAAPTIIGTVDTPAQGVDVNPDTQIAVVTDGTSGIRVINIANETNPAIIGNLSTGDARDVAIDGDIAFIADYSTNSLTSVDISTPATPVRLDTTPVVNGGRLLDVELLNDFAFGADYYFVNDVPIVYVGDPQNLSPRALLPFRAWRDDNGTGIAVDEKYVYLTAARGSSTRLYIGQYRGPRDSSMSINPNALDFGDVLLGQTNTLQVTVSNGGLGTLSITKLHLNGSDFAVGRTGFNVLAGQDAQIPVTFTPSRTAPVTGTLTIASSDPNQPLVTVSLQGERLTLPDIAISPNNFALTLTSGQSATETLTIENAIEASIPLTFSLTVNNGNQQLALSPAGGTGEVELSFDPAAYQSPQNEGQGRAGGTKKTVKPFTVSKLLTASALDVLIAAADDQATVMAAELLQQPQIAKVDWYDTSVSTPTLDELSAYDVVLTWTNYAHAAPTALGNVLADYIDGGGKVIFGVFSFYSTSELSGRIVDYLPLLSADLGNHYSAGSLEIVEPPHLIMRNVTTATDQYRDYTILAPEAELIARWDDGENFVAIKGNMIAINSYIGDYLLWEGDIPLIVYNSILYAVRGPVPLISITPTSGEVAPGGNAAININVDSTWLDIGTHEANLIIRSNDPDEAELIVPLTVTVVQGP